MAVQLTIEFKTLLELVDQLMPDEQRRLMKHLQEKMNEDTLSGEEFRAVFNSLVTGRELKASDDPLDSDNWDAADTR